MRTAFFVFIFISNFLIAQQTDSTVSYYSSLLQEENIKQHLSILASDKFEGRETGTRGQKLAAEYIAAQFKKVGLSPYKDSSFFQSFYIKERRATQKGLFKRKYVKLPTENVIAYLPGTDLKEEFIVISAHYDHLGIIDGEIYNGADDDGSGTSALIEMARVFVQAKANGNGPRRSVIFIAFAGEEKGLLGSAHYAKNPVFNLSQTVCDLNMDMIARVDKHYENDTSKYIYLIGADKLSTELHEISEANNKACCNFSIDYRYNDPKDINRFYYRSDHYNFAKKGVPVIFYFRGIHNDYHEPEDDIEKINFTTIKSVSQLVFYTAWEIANKEQRLRVDVNKK